MPCNRIYNKFSIVIGSYLSRNRCAITCPISTFCNWIRSLFARQSRELQCKLSLHSSLVAHQVRAYPSFCSMKRLGVFLLPLDGMLVHSRVTPSIKFAGTHLCPWVERGTVRVRCLVQEHNTMSPSRKALMASFLMFPSVFISYGKTLLTFSLKKKFSKYFFNLEIYYYCGNWTSCRTIQGEFVLVNSNRPRAARSSDFETILA